MRVIVTGDRFWVCPQLAAAVVKRLVDRYGPEIVIVHGDATGVDECFGRAAKGYGLTVEAAWTKPNCSNRTRSPHKRDRLCWAFQNYGDETS